MVQSVATDQLIGTKLRALLEKRYGRAGKLPYGTLVEIGRFMDVTGGAVGLWIRDKNAPTYLKMQQLCFLLGVKPDDLVANGEHRGPIHNRPYFGKLSFARDVIARVGKPEPQHVVGQDMLQVCVDFVNRYGTPERKPVRSNPEPAAETFKSFKEVGAALAEQKAPEVPTVRKLEDAIMETLVRAEKFRANNNITWTLDAEGRLGARIVTTKEFNLE